MTLTISATEACLLDVQQQLVAADLDFPFTSSDGTIVGLVRQGPALGGLIWHGESPRDGWSWFVAVPEDGDVVVHEVEVQVFGGKMTILRTLGRSGDASEIAQFLIDEKGGA